MYKGHTDGDGPPDGECVTNGKEGRVMKKSKIMALLLSVSMVLGAAGCGAPASAPAEGGGK